MTDLKLHFRDVFIRDLCVQYLDSYVTISLNTFVTSRLIIHFGNDIKQHEMMQTCKIENI